MSEQPAPAQRPGRVTRDQGTSDAVPGSREGPPAPRLLAPRVIRAFGTAHRTVHRLSGGRFGLKRPTSDYWGWMCLTTVGRRTGRERNAILGYIEDGPNLVTLAVNAWDHAEPAWWLNLRDHSDAIVRLKDASRLVRARAAQGDERARLWGRWRDLGKRSGESLMADIDAYAARASREIAVVVLEPRPG